MRTLLTTILGPTFSFCRHGVARLIDRHLGIETVGDVKLEELGVADKDRVLYQPSPWLALPRILPSNEVMENDVFMDLGSGKGRVVYQAARRYPFKRVIGVELSEALNAIARENVDRNRQRLKCKDVDLVTCDVIDYDLPDDVSVVYLNNPVTGDVFHAVVEKLIESVDAHPRRLRLIYFNCSEEPRLLQSGRFQLVRTKPGLRPSREWSREVGTRMYVLKPK